ERRHCGDISRRSLADDLRAFIKADAPRRGSVGNHCDGRAAANDRGYRQGTCSRMSVCGGYRSAQFVALSCASRSGGFQAAPFRNGDLEIAALVLSRVCIVSCGHALPCSRSLFRPSMKTRGTLKLTIYLLGFAGAALFTVLLVRQGVMAVVAAVATAGWAIAAIAAFHFV